jgi:hypothetical protein
VVAVVEPGIGRLPVSKRLGRSSLPPPSAPWGGGARPLDTDDGFEIEGLGEPGLTGAWAVLLPWEPFGARDAVIVPFDKAGLADPLAIGALDTP